MGFRFGTAIQLYFQASAKSSQEMTMKLRNVLTGLLTLVAGATLAANEVLTFDVPAGAT